jgi:hypothetical protein
MMSNKDFGLGCWKVKAEIPCYREGADVVILDYGKGQYIVRIIGVDVPKEGPVASQAREFVAKR